MAVLVACAQTATPAAPGQTEPRFTPSLPTVLVPASSEPASAQPIRPDAVDPSLLSVLPATVNGLPIVESPEAEVISVAAPEFVRIGIALAAGIAVDGPSGQFVYAVVVRLKPGPFSDGAFRDWRQSYDEGACSQADGVAATSQVEIAGRTVYTGTCTGGLRTYHVWLERQGLLIAASSTGDLRLGEVLMASLNLPVR